MGSRAGLDHRRRERVRRGHVPAKHYPNPSDLDGLTWLFYNAPLAYADLVLNGDVEGYLKRVTQYRPLDEQR